MTRKGYGNEVTEAWKCMRAGRGLEGREKEWEEEVINWQRGEY